MTSFFNDAFLVTQAFQSRIKGWHVTDELQMILKEAVVS